MYTINNRYLRPKKAAALKEHYTHPFPLLETPALWRGDNATILPVQKIDSFGWVGQGGVLDQDGCCVPLSAVETCVRPTANPPAQAEYRDQTVVYCGYMIRHWGHFLVEGCARLWYFLENDPTVDKYIFVLDDQEIREISGNYREFLELLGIWDKVEFLNRPTRFRQVIVPDLAFRRQGGYSAKYLEIFNRIAQSIPPVSEETPTKIFMSRSRLPSHKKYDFGFEAIDQFFQKNGYSVLYPESLPLSRLILYIRQAETVACVSGTLPQNMLFGRQEQTLIIAERCAFINDWQPPVDRIKELHTIYLDAHFSLYTVPMTGPFIMGCTDMVRRFAADHGMVLPDKMYTSSKYLRQCFRGYIKAYRKLYHYRWFMEAYLLPEVDYHIEAYQDSAQYFSDYLTGSRPFLPEHYFQWHYWKQFVKRILRKVGLR